MSLWRLHLIKEQGRYAVWIGQVQIGNIVFLSCQFPKCYLHTLSGANQTFPNMSEALRALREALASPPLTSEGVPTGEEVHQQD